MPLEPKVYVVVDVLEGVINEVRLFDSEEKARQRVKALWGEFGEGPFPWTPTEEEPDNYWVSPDEMTREVHLLTRYLE